jgi:tyrosyl-tRNA synthetase
VPSSRAPASALTDVVALLVSTGLASSNGDARRSLGQGQFRANGRRLAGDDELIPSDLLLGRYLLLSRGRKQHHVVEVSGA